MRPAWDGIDVVRMGLVVKHLDKMVECMAYSVTDTMAANFRPGKRED